MATATSPPADFAQLTADLAGVPDELAGEPRWLLWRFEWRPDPSKPDGGVWAKVPIDATEGHRVDGTPPDTGLRLHDALTAAERLRGRGVTVAGVGVALGDGLAGVDQDGCRDPGTGALAPWAQAIVDRLDSYTEASPRGGGVHTLCRGALPPGRRKTTSGPKIEMYDRGRFFTVTGRHLPGTPETVEARTAQLAAVHAETFPDGTPPAPPPGEGSPPAAPVPLEDDELLERMFGSKHGATIRRLWDGDPSAHATGGNDGQSEADLALCNHLAWWTDRDEARIDRLFRRSGLYRADKWGRRADYRAVTIKKAIAGVAKGYGGPPLEVDPDEVAGRTNGHPAAPTPPESADGDAPPTTLEDVIGVFQKWLHLPDTGAVKAVLATVVANRLPGDPAWLMVIGGSGWGKTELLQSLRGLRYAHVVATVTEPALLSGTSKKERDAKARGGLLREIGDFGLLVLKDFTSILSMHREARGQVLAALREIYDGDWTRYVGVDGGKSLSWQGKLGLVAGCTPTIDSHHAVIGTMGERFVSFRLRAEEDEALAKQAVAHAGQERAMRQQLSQAVADLFAGLPIPDTFPAPGETAQGRIIDLAVLVCRCRSPVERDSHTRDIELIPDREAPSRLVLVLTRLFVGMRLLGVPAGEAWRVLRRIGMDSMPALRCQVFEYLAGRGAPVTTTDVATHVRYPTQTTRRTLEDLAAHDVVLRIPGGEGKADQWELSPFATRLYAKVEQTFPEVSEGV